MYKVDCFNMFTLKTKRPCFSLQRSTITYKQKCQWTCKEHYEKKYSSLTKANKNQKCSQVPFLDSCLNFNLVPVTHLFLKGIYSFAGLRKYLANLAKGTFHSLAAADESCSLPTAWSLTSPTQPDEYTHLWLAALYLEVPADFVHALLGVLSLAFGA